MTPRQRVINALNRKPVDRVPVDFGGTVLTGAHASVIAKLRQALGLDKPDARVKVFEPAQMLGEVAEDLRDKLRVDVVSMPLRMNIFGFENAGWKPWTTFDGTDVLVAGQFNTTPDAQGNIVQYPQGDRSVAPSMKMPKGGFYFDAIIRQKPIDEGKLNPRDNLEEFTMVSDEDLRFWEKNSNGLYNNTDLAITMGLPGTAFGDIFLVPSPFLKDPKGIRDLEEWYISTVSRRDYILEVFDKQADIAVKNIEMIYQAVGDRIQMVFICGTDLAAQDTLFCGPQTYRELYMPFHARVNNWIHRHTGWKTMKHCCGACRPLIDGFIEAGFDVLNPVQCSAKGMEPQGLVEDFSDRIVFWGGGVDTQRTLPFGTPEEVFQQVQERTEIFNRKNGFVFTAIHNIQCNTPVENVIAMFKALGRSL
ncbi:MAG: uroporphyrinogen decarboxylase family protein [Planctomycetales bacterium]|nr:uroporphyrinogen decarboxylase family protein [Planctomycetales bacterium]